LVWRRSRRVEQPDPLLKDVAVYFNYPAGVWTGVPASVGMLDTGQLTLAVVAEAAIEGPGIEKVDCLPEGGRPRTAVDVHTKLGLMVDIFKKLRLVREVPMSAQPPVGRRA
jgi:hypothetical protein